MLQQLPLALFTMILTLCNHYLQNICYQQYFTEETFRKGKGIRHRL